MSRTEEFEELRPLLFSIAYRILGSESRARDAVEETRRGYERASAVPASPRAFLSAEVTRISRAARRPDPAPPTPAAAVLLLERLSPLERAVFALREIFGCGTAQIAAAVGCSEAVGRRLTAAATPFATPTAPGTSGGAAPYWPDRIAGADQVARVLAAIVPALLRIGVTMRPQEVDGGPGAVFHDRNGTALGALALGILDGRIQTVRWTTAPTTTSGDRDTAA